MPDPTAERSTRLVAIDVRSRDQPPPALYAQLTGLGVRLLDPSRSLVLEAPRESFERPDWPAVEASLGRYGLHLREVARFAAGAQERHDLAGLRERVQALPEGCAPVVAEAVGGPHRLRHLLEAPAGELAPVDVHALQLALHAGVHHQALEGLAETAAQQKESFPDQQARERVALAALREEMLSDRLHRQSKAFDRLLMRLLARDQIFPELGRASDTERQYGPAAGLLEVIFVLLFPDSWPPEEPGWLSYEDRLDSRNG